MSPARACCRSSLSRRPERSTACGVLAAFQAVARPAPGEAPFCRSRMLSREGEIVSPARRTISALRRGRVQTARAGLGQDRPGTGQGRGTPVAGPPRVRPRPQRVGPPGPKRAAPFAHPVRPHAERPPDRRGRPARPASTRSPAPDRPRRDRATATTPPAAAYCAVRHHQPRASRHVRPSLQLPCANAIDMWRKFGKPA